MARAPDEALAYPVKLLGDTARAVERQDLGAEQRVGAGNRYHSGGAEPHGELDALRAGVRQVVGLELSEPGERPAKRDDQVSVAIVEVGRVRGKARAKLLLDAHVHADGVLGFQRRIIRKG